MRIIMLLVLFLFPGLASAFTIVSPKPGAQIPTGSDVKVQVKADAGEQFSEVKIFFAADEDFQWNPLTGFYEKIIKSPVKKTGPMKIQVTAMDKQGNVYQAEVEVIVTLPSSVTVTGIRVRDDQRYIFMSRISEDEKIRVYGQYSDGVERDVSSTATGTTYTSSDEKVATVDSNGLVTAVAPGTAKITIKNGKYEITVRVDVKPKK